MGGALPPQSTSLSLAWEIAYVYLLPPTPEKFQKFVHIEALGKNCITFDNQTKDTKKMLAQCESLLTSRGQDPAPCFQIVFGDDYFWA